MPETGARIVQAPVISGLASGLDALGLGGELGLLAGSGQNLDDRQRDRRVRLLRVLGDPGRLAEVRAALGRPLDGGPEGVLGHRGDLLVPGGDRRHHHVERPLLGLGVLDHGLEGLRRDVADEGAELSRVRLDVRMLDEVEGEGAVVQELDGERALRHLVGADQVGVVARVGVVEGDLITVHRRFSPPPFHSGNGALVVWRGA